MLTVAVFVGRGIAYRTDTARRRAAQQEQ